MKFEDFQEGNVYHSIDGSYPNHNFKLMSDGLIYYFCIKDDSQTWFQWYPKDRIKEKAFRPDAEFEIIDSDDIINNRYIF